MTTIVDFDDLKSVLDLEKTSFDDYPDLELIADRVHADLESYVGRKLNTVGRKTESGFILDGAKKIDLTNLPVTEILSVEIDGNLLTSSNYKIGPYGIILLGAYDDNYTVTTKGGFKTIPDQVYNAELTQIVYEYQNINNLAVKTFSNDAGSTTTPGFVILTHVMEMLQPYLHVKQVGF